MQMNNKNLKYCTFSQLLPNKGVSLFWSSSGRFLITQAKTQKRVVNFCFSDEKYLAYVTLFQKPFEVIILPAFVTVGGFLPLWSLLLSSRFCNPEFWISRLDSLASDLLLNCFPYVIFLKALHFDILSIFVKLIIVCSFYYFPHLLLH